MISPVEYLSTTPEINEIVDILMSNSHGAYPIVENTNGGPLYRNNITASLDINLEHLQDTVCIHWHCKGYQTWYIDWYTDKCVQWQAFITTLKVRSDRPIYKDGTVLTKHFCWRWETAFAPTLCLIWDRIVTTALLALLRKWAYIERLSCSAHLDWLNLVVVNKCNFVVGIDFMGFKIEERRIRAWRSEFFNQTHW